MPTYQTWAGGTVYQKPVVHQPVYEHRPDETVETVHDFSKKVRLLKFTNPSDWNCTGMAERGEPEEYDFWCVIKPESNQSQVNRTKLGDSGEYSEGRMVLLYDPFHPYHGELHLQLSDEISDYSGFADVIEYQDKLWAVRGMKRLDIDQGGSYKRYIGKAVIEQWTDKKSHFSEFKHRGL